MRDRVTRIGLRPGHACLAGALEVSGYDPIIGDLDKKSLAIAGTVSEFIGSRRWLPSSSSLSGIGIAQRKVGPGEREVRVQLNGALLQRYSRHQAFVHQGSKSRAIRLERFERSGRAFFQGFVVHLSRLPGLAGPPPETPCN